MIANVFSVGGRAGQGLSLVIPANVWEERAPGERSGQNGRVSGEMRSSVSRGCARGLGWGGWWWRANRAGDRGAGCGTGQCGLLGRVGGLLREDDMWVGEDEMWVREVGRMICG